jgi:hypothetical protein
MNPVHVWIVFPRHVTVQSQAGLHDGFHSDWK